MLPPQNLEAKGGLEFTTEALSDAWKFKLVNTLNDPIPLPSPCTAFSKATSLSLSVDFSVCKDW